MQIKRDLDLISKLLMFPLKDGSEEVVRCGFFQNRYINLDLLRVKLR